MTEAKLPDPLRETPQQRADTVEKIAAYLNTLCCKYEKSGPPLWPMSDAALTAVVRLWQVMVSVNCRETSASSWARLHGIKFPE